MTAHIMIMAAGTGGHVTPGIAVARELAAQGATLSWLGTTHGIENTLVPQQLPEVALHRLAFAGLRGKGVLGAIKGAWQLCAATLSARRLLKTTHTQAVLGFGGYVCVPGGLAARSLRIPLVLVNADADILLSNKVLQKQAQVLCCGFSGGTASQRPNAVVTGNPVRREIAQLAPPDSRAWLPDGTLRVLVLGGSLGAQVLNQTVPQAIAALQRAGKRVHVTHQCGAAHLHAATQAYADAGLAVTPVAFIDDMAQSYAQADIVICRAGAITASELCAAGVGSILVPFIASTTAHQVGNAQRLAAQGAAIHLPQTQLSADALVQVLGNLDATQLRTMALAARSLSQPEATQTVASIILQQLNLKGNRA